MRLSEKSAQEGSMGRQRLILTNLREQIANILGDQLDAMYLYGSRARGDARPNADFDILIVLQDAFDYSSMLAATSEIVAQISLDSEIVISRAFVTRQQFDTEQSPFLLNVRREAIEI
jgi:predicted nucleotidyltransferase